MWTARKGTSHNLCFATQPQKNGLTATYFSGRYVTSATHSELRAVGFSRRLTPRWLVRHGRTVGFREAVECVHVVGRLPHEAESSAEFRRRWPRLRAVCRARSDSGRAQTVSREETDRSRGQCPPTTCTHNPFVLRVSRGPVPFPLAGKPLGNARNPDPTKDKCPRARAVCA